MKEKYYADWDITDLNWIPRLEEHLDTTTPDQYIFKNPGDSLVAEQLMCYPKARLKFPTWHKTGMVYTKKAIEQSSGELAAEYKSSLMFGEVLWDLTGGLGMDSVAFAKHGKTIHHNEPDKKLSDIAKHNHSLLGYQNIYYHTELAENLVTQIQSTDTIYIDPSRRTERGRIFLLSDCVPDVISLLPALKKIAPRIIIKLSPIYDIKRIFHELPETKQIHVVSVQGEVREILAVLDQSIPEYIASVTLPENIKIIKNNDLKEYYYSGTLDVSSGNFLHVVDSAIFKAQTLATFAHQHNMAFWGTGGYLFSKNATSIGCMSYQVLETMDYKPKLLKKKLTGKKVNIHKRNFPIEVSFLYKILGTSMGDDYHLFFTSLHDGSKKVCITKPPITS